MNTHGVLVTVVFFAVEAAKITAYFLTIVFLVIEIIGHYHSVIW